MVIRRLQMWWMMHRFKNLWYQALRRAEADGLVWHTSIRHERVTDDSRAELELVPERDE